MADDQPNFARWVPAWFWGAAIIASIIILINVFLQGGAFLRDRPILENDDTMRLLSVRAWLNGQAWYDMTQYRLLPPEGVSMHWSRYLDVAIAAVIIPLSWVMPMADAEMVGAVVWPTLILLATMAVAGFGTARVFGPISGGFAMLCVAMWPIFKSLHSRPGSLDHHNVQMLLMMGLALAVIWPNRLIRAAVFGGLFGALSLAIGLETLAFVVVGGLALLLRAYLLPQPLALRMLLGFCLALGLGSLLLMMGQTAPAEWGASVCDRLGLPVLVLILIATVASITPFAFSGYVPKAWQKFALTVVLCVGGLAVAWPLLSHCSDGPYAAMPLEAQQIITTQIIEASPLVVYAQRYTAMAVILTVPIIAAFMWGGTLWLQQRRQVGAQDSQHEALGLLLFMGLSGLALTFLQIRAVINPAVTVPILAGALIAHGIRTYHRHRSLAAGLGTLAGFVFLTTPSLITAVLLPLYDVPGEEGKGRDAACETAASFAPLNAIPVATVLADLNTSPSVMLFTHHSAMAAPYHRSGTAFLNGVVPFDLEQPELAAYLRQTGAEYLLLCANAPYDSTVLDQLAAGGPVEFLRPIALDNDVRLLFEILDDD